MDEKLINNLFEQKEALERKIQRLEARLSEMKSLNEKMNTAFQILKAYDSRIGDRLSAEATPKTVGAMALNLLKDNPKGLTASEILEKIQSRWMPSLLRTSLSPPLSRLKRQGFVSYANGIWSIELKPTHQSNLFTENNKGFYNQQVKLENNDDTDEF